MKTLPTLLFFCFISFNVLASSGNEIANQNPSLYEPGEKVSLYVPGILFKIGSLFLDDDAKEAKYVMRRVRGMRLLVREGMAARVFKDSPQLNRIQKRMEKKNYEEFMSVEDEDGNVSMSLRENKKGFIRNVAMMVNSDDGIVFLNLRCKLKPKYLKELVKQANKRYSKA